MREDCVSKPRISTRSLCLFVALLLALPVASFAASEQPLADVLNRENELIFVPNSEFDELVLTIQGPCDYQYREVITKGEAVFKLDETTIDGVYSYYLVRHEAVDSSIVKVLKQARKEGDAEVPKALCRAGKLPGQPVSQAEGFRVVEGTIIYDPFSEEKDFAGASDNDNPKLNPAPTGEIARLGTTPIARDFVINDDLIVDGSACIGFDCVNGESFSFDTIRLKENNLRIKFDDTSVAASFPRTDWQLTANDSANGGASKFSIDDISGSRTPFTVEANARSHSLYVDDGGRIGNRTSTPSVEIHTIDGDTPTLRLQQDGSSGFAPQTWDVAGNETNFFIRDVSNGSTLPFRIRPGAPTSAIFIDTDGDVGMGTASPDADGLHVVGGFYVTETDDGSTPSDIFEIRTDADNTARMRFDDGDKWTMGGGAGDTYIISEVGDAVEMTLQNNGDMTIGGTLTENSDVNAKENFSSINAQEVLAKVLALPVTTWNYKEDERRAIHLGPMAQDFYSAFGLGGTDKGIAPRNVAGVALVAIQGLNEQIEARDSRIESLEQQNNDLVQQNSDLATRLATLEAMVQGLVNGQ